MLIGQAANEIIVFRKVGLTAMTGAGNDVVSDHAGAAITHLMVRMSAGRLREARELLGDIAFAEVRGGIHPLMRDEAKSAYKEIKRYFNKSDNLVATLRNQSAFHTDITGARAALEELRSEDLSEWLAPSRGNCFYGSGAAVSAVQLAMFGQGGSLGEKLDFVFEDIRGISARFEEYAEGFAAAFAEKYLGMTADSLRAAEISIKGPDIRTFRLPYYLDDEAVTEEDL